MALRVTGRVRTLRRLVSAVVGLCDPQGSTAHEIIEWDVRHPCDTSHCQHSPAKDSDVRKDRARLLAGLRYSVLRGVLEERGGRYKLAMESGGRIQGGRQDARPRVGDVCRRRGRSCRRPCRACALSTTARATQRHRHRQPARRRTCSASARATRRGPLPRRRRRPSVRHLQGGRARPCRSRRAAPRARPRPRPKGKGKGQAHAKDKGKAGGGGTSGSGGCVGCGEARPDTGGEKRRASHLGMFR